MKRSHAIGLLAVLVILSTAATYVFFMDDGNGGKDMGRTAESKAVGRVRTPVAKTVQRAPSVSVAKEAVPVKPEPVVVKPEPAVVEPEKPVPSEQAKPMSSKPDKPVSVEPRPLTPGDGDEPAKPVSTAVHPFIKSVEGGVAVYDDDPTNGGRLFLKRSIPVRLLSPPDKDRFDKGFYVKDQAEALTILEGIGSMAD